jgi:hypothetical protein
MPNTLILPRNGMTFAEFRQLKPGVLPETILYDGGVALQERLFQIEGSWGFGFRDGLLYSLDYASFSMVDSPASFNAWLSSAKKVIADFSRSLGQPVSHVQGEARYFDHMRSDTAKPAQRRHVYQEARWSIANTEILISCVLKSNLEEGESAREDVSEYWNYDFRIDVAWTAQPSANTPSIYGRFYLGMPLANFAERHPELFPQGTAPSGQWGHTAAWQGLQGEWSYVFMQGKLVQFQFNAYFQSDQVNQHSFQTCRKGALGIIEDLKGKYGKPNESVDLGAGSFVSTGRDKNPYKEIVSAKWLGVDRMRVLVELQWLHVDAAYQALIVNVQATDKGFGGYA